MDDVEKLIEGDGGYEYLIRSISLVTLLYERGILGELIESGRITQEEVAERAEIIRGRFPGFAPRDTRDKSRKPGADTHG